MMYGGWDNNKEINLISAESHHRRPRYQRRKKINRIPLKALRNQIRNEIRSEKVEFFNSNKALVYLLPTFPERGNFCRLH